MRVWMADMYEGEGLINYQALADAGCAGVVLKSSMGGGIANLNWLTQAVNGVRQAGLRLGFYHWVDPTQSASRQAGYLRQATERFAPDFLSLDNEQWWASWDKFYKYRRGEIPASQVPRLRGDQIVRAYLDTMAAVEGLRPLMMQYSARWFQQGVSMPVRAFLDSDCVFQPSAGRPKNTRRAAFSSNSNSLYPFLGFHAIIFAFPSFQTARFCPAGRGWRHAAHPPSPKANFLAKPGRGCANPPGGS